MLRKLFGAKNEDSGNPVGSTESVVSRIDNNNMPGPIQKVDLWLRQHVPMKKPEDCLYCKIMKCLGIAGGTVWFVSYAPRALKTKCTSVRSTLVYGILTANIALSLTGLAVVIWFDLDLPDSKQLQNSSIIEHFKQQISNRKQLNKVNAKTVEDRDG